MGEETVASNRESQRAHASLVGQPRVVGHVWVHMGALRSRWTDGVRVGILR